MNDSNPQFLVFVGPMFGGKTSRMLSALERFKYQHKRVIVFKPKLDDRYSADDVVSHNGWKVPAITIKTGADMLQTLSDAQENPHIVAVDEAFMIPGIAEALVWLFRMGYTVVVSTLDMSSLGKPFHEVEKMLPWATHVEKCAAVCTVCGRDAYYTHKKQGVVSDADVQVGGDEMYESRCFSHHVGIDNREKP